MQVCKYCKSLSRKWTGLLRTEYSSAVIWLGLELIEAGVGLGSGVEEGEWKDSKMRRCLVLGLERRWSWEEEEEGVICCFFLFYPFTLQSTTSVAFAVLAGRSIGAKPHTIARCCDAQKYTNQYSVLCALYTVFLHTRNLENIRHFGGSSWPPSVNEGERKREMMHTRVRSVCLIQIYSYRMLPYHAMRA